MSLGWTRFSNVTPQLSVPRAVRYTCFKALMVISEGKYALAVSRTRGRIQVKQGGGGYLTHRIPNLHSLLFVAGFLLLAFYPFLLAPWRV